MITDPVRLGSAYVVGRRVLVELKVVESVVSRPYGL